MEEKGVYTVWLGNLFTSSSPPVPNEKKIEERSQQKEFQSYDLRFSIPKPLILSFGKRLISSSMANHNRQATYGTGLSFLSSSSFVPPQQNHGVYLGGSTYSVVTSSTLAKCPISTVENYTEWAENTVSGVETAPPRPDSFLLHVQEYAYRC
jgi:hypothetical protein